jgi:transcription initiation factor TFIIIB Brf1 subunit/transcription initiation factor TFIIB
MRRDSNRREDGNFCPNCASSCFVEDHSRGDTICSNCGLCLPELMMAEAPDRRTFLGDAKDHNQHFRVDPFFDLAGYSTVIPETRLNRLQHRLQSCGASMQQRNLFSGFAHISAFGAMFELPKVVTDTATQMLFEFSKRIDGVNFGSDSFAVSVCYLALEKHLCVKPIREVAAVSGIDEKSLRKCLKKLRKTIPPAAKKFWFTLLSSTNWTARALSALCSLALMNKV